MNQSKTAASYIIAAIIIFLISCLFYYLYFINYDITWRYIGTFGIFAAGVTWILYKCHKNQKKEPENNISKFVLVARDGELEKEWICKGNSSFLIGKGFSGHEVDMELGDTYYAMYISNEHAVLNYSGGFWYIEDLHSEKGTGIKKCGEEFSLRLKPMTSYKIDQGDMLYISKAKILVK